MNLLEEIEKIDNQISNLNKIKQRIMLKHCENITKAIIIGNKDYYSLQDISNKCTMSVPQLKARIKEGKLKAFYQKNQYLVTKIQYNEFKTNYIEVN